MEYLRSADDVACKLVKACCGLLRCTLLVSNTYKNIALQQHYIACNAREELQ